MQRSAVTRFSGEACFAVEELVVELAAALEVNGPVPSLERGLQADDGVHGASDALDRDVEGGQLSSLQTPSVGASSAKHFAGR